MHHLLSEALSLEGELDNKEWAFHDELTTKWITNGLWSWKSGRYRQYEEQILSPGQVEDILSSPSCSSSNVEAVRHLTIIS